MSDKLEFFEITNQLEYNPLELHPESPFTQSAEYGDWQKLSGTKIWQFGVRKNNKLVGLFQIAKYPLPPLRKFFLYIAHGPILKNSAFFDWALFKDWLTKFARRENASFVRFDPFPPINKLPKVFAKAPIYSYKAAHFQPKFEWRINLSEREDNLLQAMHQKTRYNIRLAERKGVKVEIIKEGLNNYFNEFYDLLKITGERDGFFLHGQEYYKKVLEESEKNDSGLIVVASFGGKILAINFVHFFGDTAMYVYGGSSNEGRNLMPTYIAQWKGMLEAKERGFKYYNFGGYSPENSHYKGWQGLSEFKRKFGGEILEYGDFYDLVIQPIWYKLYNIRKKIKAKRG